jgi:hypothetical protein
MADKEQVERLKQSVDGWNKWPARLREQIMEYHILDFSKWQDEGEFVKMFRKLVEGLDLLFKEE